MALLHDEGRVRLPVSFSAWCDALEATPGLTLTPLVRGNIEEARTTQCQCRAEGPYGFPDFEDAKELARWEVGVRALTPRFSVARCWTAKSEAVSIRS